MIRDDLQLRLSTAFPSTSDGGLIRGFQEGILLADSLFDNEPFLGTCVGRDLRGHLRRAGVMFRLSELCRLGDLPFEATMGSMPRGNWHWLELRSGRFVAHLCRTEGTHAFPDDTLTRQDDRLRNQNDLFEPNAPPLSEVVDNSGKMAVWLTFGGGLPGQLQHLCWALPAADGQAWLAHINVLRRAFANNVVTEPSPTASKGLSLKFKEHVEELLAARPVKADRM